MKRTNLMIDEDILLKAKAESGLNTYSAVVNLALKEFLKRRIFENIDEFASSGVWDGNLNEMRHSSRDNNDSG